MLKVARQEKLSIADKNTVEVDVLEAMANCADDIAATDLMRTSHRTIWSGEVSRMKLLMHV